MLGAREMVNQLMVGILLLVELVGAREGKDGFRSIFGFIPKFRRNDLLKNFILAITRAY